MVDRVIPEVIKEFQSMIWVNATLGPINLRNRVTACGTVPLPTQPMIDSDFHIIFDGAVDDANGSKEEQICDSYQNLAGVTETCAFDLIGDMP